MAEDKAQAALRAVAAEIEQHELRWQAAETPLSALSSTEQKKYLGLKVTQAERRAMKAAVMATATEEKAQFAAGVEFAAPISVDWRTSGYVTPIRNQGPCGSCVSHGTCASIEATIRIKMQDPNLAIDLSEAFCQFCGGGSCSGWGLTSGLEFAKTTGIVDEACMPYQPQNMDCEASRCSDWESRLTKITSYTQHASVQARKNAIATIGPVVAGMAVYSDFYHYNSGIYEKTDSATLSGYHCIAVVGYNDTDGYWIIKNSWGPNWGENGFCNIAYGQADLLIDTDWAFYSVDPDVVPTKGSGAAQHLFVDKTFGGIVRLWAYAGDQWCHRTVSNAELKGLVQELFDAERVDVWWDGPTITLIRGWKA